MVKKVRPTSATLVNFQDCHAAVQELRQAGARAAVDFQGLLSTDADIRRKYNLPTERAVIGFASVDTRAERGDAQERFIRAAEASGIQLERIDFRDAYINPTMNPEEGGGRTRGVQTLAPAISFALGALADRTEPTVVVIAGGYEHAYAIRQVVARGGRVVLAFWRSCADQRLFTRELFGGEADKQSRLSFVDLEDYPAALGGLDVRARSGVASGKADGINALF